MADKSGGKPSTMWSNRPVPMKLFAAWEIDKTPSNCTPRLCTLTITKLVLLKPLGPDITTIMIAVKLQSSKRTLRSNEISVPTAVESSTSVSYSSTSHEIDLDLTFSLQYSHFLKRSGNQLQIMLQRRKRYKNRAILGFKTLALGIINMAEVLQRANNMDRELELLGNIKEIGKNEIVARIVMSTLKTQPVDQENAGNGRLKNTLDRSAEDSDDDDFSSPEEASDSEAVEDGPANRSVIPTTRERLNQWRRQVNNRKNRKLFSPNNVGPDSNAQQRNLKQKFIALLKKFRIPDSEAFESDEQYQAALIASQRNRDIVEDLFEEEDVEDVDDLSDSDQDFDDMSISSTPKPSLRPFFSSCTLVGPEAETCDKDFPKRIESDSQDNSGPEQTPDTSDTSLKQPPQEDFLIKKPSSAEKKSKLFNRDKHSGVGKDKKLINPPVTCVPLIKERSLSYTISKDNESSPRKSVFEQLNRIFSSDDFVIPNQFILVHASEGPLNQFIAQQLHDRQLSVVATYSISDIRASINSLVTKIQKFCNCNSRAPSPIRVALLGSDAFINTFLRLYLETFSSKPTDWQNYLRFYIIPLNINFSTLAKYIGSIDPTYYSNFCDGSWKDLFDDHTSSVSLTHDIIHRILNYMNGANAVLQIPIAEAMLTYKEKNQDDQSLQVFIPFICDVKIGIMEGYSLYGNHSLDDDSQNLSSSPPNSASKDHIEKSHSLTSPLSSKEQQQHTVTPPSSPSISANLSGPNLISSNINALSSIGQQPSQSNTLPSTSQQLSNNLTSSICISSGETIDLQVDYWPLAIKSNEGTSKKAESSKFTLKNTFRTLHVSRLPNLGELSSPSLTLSYITKEKKQKIMRLGKKKEKEREPENKFQVAEGIHRLVCSCKTAQAPLKVIIDGVEWSGVKFFQLTAQWQTHMKFFPVATYVQYESNRNRINPSNSLTV